MKGIDALIRLHRQHLDVKRVYRTNLETKRADLEIRAQLMALEFEDERKTANTSLEARFTFSAYAKRMTQSLRVLATEMVEIDTRTDRLSEEIADAFQTLKGYELTRESREKKKTEKLVQRERADLDEIGATQHGRRDVL